MRVLVVVLAVFSLGVVAAVRHDMIDIDVTTIKPSVEDTKHKLNSGGDDDDGSADVQSDEGSGSGSGQPSKSTPTTDKPRVIHINVNTEAKSTQRPATQSTKKPSTERIESTDEPVMSTEKVVDVKREQPKTKEPSKNTEKVSTTTSEDLLGGGVSSDGDVAARKAEDEAVQVLTTEVIAAVVVGGVCAIILIAFLVYRLRKRDEGSYILTDNAFKDTNKLRGDTGKEAFV